MTYFIRVFFGSFVLMVIIRLVMPRIKMLRRAKALLKKMPNHENTSIYLQFSSAFPHRKKREMDAKITEMAKDGWVFLKAGEAKPLKTLRSWGGGLNLYFIRDIADLDCTRG